MAQPIYVADAFTSRAFAGNPAAVCPLAAPADEHWMRCVAAEMNLSETAFLHPDTDGWRLRWLTPTVEVDLCGHATLASAHILWETRRAGTAQPVPFITRSGTLTAAKRGEFIELDFPAQPASPCAPPVGLLESLGVQARWVGNNGTDYCVEVADEDVVRGLQPNHAQLARLPVRGVIVTARSSTADYDFVSRFFAPGSGVAEDPVTGSAHCCLAPYWAERLGKAEMVGFQASVRGGEVRVQLCDDRVKLQGQAVTVWRGELLV